MPTWRRRPAQRPPAGQRNIDIHTVGISPWAPLAVPKKATLAKDLMISQVRYASGKRAPQ